MSVTTNPSPKFFDLPMEIRLAIYDFLLPTSWKVGKYKIVRTADPPAKNLHNDLASSYNQYDAGLSQGDLQAIKEFTIERGLAFLI